MASPEEQCDPPITEQEFQSPSHSKDPNLSPALPLYKRIYVGFRLWTFKGFVWLALRALSVMNRKLRPNFVKYYDVRPGLQCRVFIPSNIDPTSTTKLPTLINVHGGGFALCDPVVDDHFVRPFADKNSILIVSINYSKSPRHRFPTATNDTVALINAVLSDPLLPIDHSRVGIVGTSAGGNLVLSAALHPSLRGKISAIIPIYPVVEFGQRDKGISRPDHLGNKDMLENSSSWFQWGYISADADRKHPLLSPIYAPRAAFATQKMFFVGAEYDSLCREAHAMAKRLAGTYDASEGMTDGVVDVSKFSDAWDTNGVKWRMYRGMQHGFTQTGPKGEHEKQRLKAVEDFNKELGRWLKEDVWGSTKKDGQQENGRLVNL